MPIAPPNYITLSAMITPAIFLTANGSLIISTSNRMSRVVDRIRVLNDLGDSLFRGASALDYREARIGHIQSQLSHLIRRANLIRGALTMLYLAFGAFVLTSLGLAIDVLASNRLVALPTAFAIVGVSFLLGASVNLVREALMALGSSREEIRFYRDLHERRRADGIDRVPGATGPGPPEA
jgi:Protein of unknown function (DUF2721)